jgi:hypothetical protein
MPSVPTRPVTVGPAVNTPVVLLTVPSARVTFSIAHSTPLALSCSSAYESNVVDGVELGDAAFGNANVSNVFGVARRSSW